ncbi:MAG: hypothetical protein CM1200mP28_02460 [Deltaproteobacteria bacterium]|nr:MAG: hypothetical protein CM1200mP28_02460 [Deltaproteobacteria bacterium]
MVARDQNFCRHDAQSPLNGMMNLYLWQVLQTFDVPPSMLFVGAFPEQLDLLLHEAVPKELLSG